MTKREEQKKKRMWQILEKGLELFVLRGYEGTTISDIAKAAGMSMGLMFHYFPSKEALYEALIEIGLEGPRQMMQGVSMQSPIGFFSQMAEQIFLELERSPFTARMFVLMHRAYMMESTPNSVREKLGGMDFYRETEGLIRQGQMAGEIRQGNPLALSAAYWVAVQGVAELRAMDDTIPLPKCEWIIEIIRRK